MEQKQKQKLFDTFPEMFPNTVNYRGRAEIACGDGWFHIIMAMCETIQQDYNFRKSRWETSLVYKGNAYWTEAVCADAENAFRGVGLPGFVQIKEKFGSLRIYADGHYNVPFVEGAISFAEHMSTKVCEKCGAPGTLRANNWWRVSCETCEPTTPDAA